VRIKKAHEQVTTGSPETSGIPRAMVLTVSSALSPVTGLDCHRRSADREQNLTPASGRQDHTTSPSALVLLVAQHPRVHRIPHPTSVTMANAPSCERGIAESLVLIWPTAEAKYFLLAEWTSQISLNALANFDFT
jgi:hypothetical protein